MTTEDLKALIFVIRNVYDSKLMRERVVSPQLIQKYPSSPGKFNRSPTRKTQVSDLGNLEIDLNITKSASCTTRTARNLHLSVRNDFDLFHRMLLGFNTSKQHDLYAQRSALRLQRQRTTNEQIEAEKRRQEAKTFVDFTKPQLIAPGEDSEN